MLHNLIDSYFYVFLHIEVGSHILTIQFDKISFMRNVL